MAFQLGAKHKEKSGVEILLSRRGRWVVLTLVTLLGCWGIYAGYMILSNGTPAAAQGRGFQQSVPVVVAAAKQGDIHVYITGLGTVTALYTATVHSQVDGQVLQVPFKEGDIVKKGALLVEIDPRPFEAALLQAEAE